MTKALTLVRIGIRYDITAQVYEAYCPALDTMSTGLTAREAREAVKQAIHYMLVAPVHDQKLTREGYELLALEM